MARVVVVGGGVGGLAVAMRLAVRRHEVTLVERRATLGGKLAAYERDGFVFDTGPSLLTLPAVFRELFGRTGRPLEECVELVEPEPGMTYRFADGTRLELPPADPGACAAVMGDVLGGRAYEDWRALMRRGADVWAATRVPYLESPVTTAALLRQARSWRNVRTVAPFTTLRTLGHRLLADPRQRILLDRYATYTGSDPRRAPAALCTIPYVEQNFGIHHVAGGLHRLASAMGERARERGVDVRLRAPVADIRTEAGRVSGVGLDDGEVLPADVVVSDIDASVLYGRLLGGHGAATARRLRRTTPSLSGYSLLLAVRGRTPGLSHHTVLFPDDYDAELDSVFGRRSAPPDDPTVYVCAPDDPAMRPAGHEALFVLVNAPRHGTGSGAIDWRTPGLAESYRDRILEIMARRGLDVRDRVLWSVIRTPADLEDDTASPGGAIYGSSSNGVRAAFGRPANSAAIPGLFLVGGSAHPGGGLPLVGMSAAIVADLVGPA